MIEIYKALFLRELEKLNKEILSFEEESNMWKVEGGISNSSGNLCLHLIGNLNTYIGQKVGGTSYIRDRPFEFAGKDVPRSELLQMIGDTKAVISTTFDGLDQDALGATYPEQVLGYEMSTGYFIVHLLSHFSYHLGQINYLRRLLEGK